MFLFINNYTVNTLNIFDRNHPAVILNVMVCYSVYKHNMNHKTTSFSNSLYGDMFWLHISHPQANVEQCYAHTVCTQWDPISFANRVIYIHKIGHNITYNMAPENIL